MLASHPSLDVVAAFGAIDQALWIVGVWAITNMHASAKDFFAHRQRRIVVKMNLILSKEERDASLD